LPVGSLYAVDSIDGNLRYIAAGPFTQGSPDTEMGRDTNEGQPFQRMLTKNLAVMETEVTRQMWASLLAVQASLPAVPTNTPYGSGMANPVQSLTWYDAVLYATLLSQLQGLPCVCHADNGFGRIS
jgi:formylglycine-generating enzyme required for sulfatase activity